jgi:hypothetical protein
MAKANHPIELVGTWQWLETYSKSGELMPHSPTMPKIVYVFAPDGSAGFMPGHFPGAPTGMPMRWGVIDGRLRIGGAKGLKGHSTHPFECPDASHLVLYDRSGGRSVFGRVPGESS